MTNIIKLGLSKLIMIEFLSWFIGLLYPILGLMIQISGTFLVFVVLLRESEKLTPKK